MTKFVILIKDDTGGRWRRDGVVEAHNAEAAIRNSYLKRPESSIVEMVAVPERSWRPQAIRSEPQPPKLILGEPAPAQKAAPPVDASHKSA